MSLGTIIIMLGYIYICMQYKKKPKEAKWRLFCITIFVSTFVNCGYAFKIGSITITYNVWCQILYVIGSMLFASHNTLRINIKKKILFSDCLFVFALLAGLLVLYYSKERPLIIPWTTRMDDVYYQLSKAEYPKLGYGNYLNIIYCMVFFCFLEISVCFLDTEDYVVRLKRGIKKFFKVLTVSMIIEFIVNNIISPTLIRSCVRAVTGTATYGYDVPQKRFGLYGILQLFNESSYFCVFIILYLLLLVEGVTKDFDKKWICFSILALGLSGATSAWIIIPIAILAIVRDVLEDKSKSKILNIIIMGAFFGIMVVILFLINGDYLIRVISGMSNKLFTYLTGAHDSLAVSGSIRHMGNQYAYDAFSKSILWGWGIGTLRSYGLLPSALGCFGVIGFTIIMKYLKEHCNLMVNKQNAIAFVLLAIYSTSILSVAYLYDPTIVLITFPFNALIRRKSISV